MPGSATPAIWHSTLKTLVYEPHFASQRQSTQQGLTSIEYPGGCCPFHVTLSSLHYLGFPWSAHALHQGTYSSINFL